MSKEQQSSARPPFVNPYSVEEMAKTGDEQHKTTVYLGGRDLAFLRGLDTNSGIIQSTVGILLKKLITELKQNGITEYDPQAYERAITHARISFSNGGGPESPSPVPHQPPQAPSGDDGRGAIGLARNPEQPSIQPSDVQRPPESVSGGGSVPKAVRKVKKAKRTGA